MTPKKKTRSPAQRRRAKAPRRKTALPTSTSTPAAVADSVVVPMIADPEVVAPGESEQFHDPDVTTRMQELEARLDRMIDAHARDRGKGEAPSAPPVPRPTPPPSRPALPPDGVLDTARELLSADFYLRKWGRMGLRNRSQEVDDFGHDPVYEQRVLPFFEFLYEKYFRVEVRGLDNVPSEGRCLLVANHSGTIPFDGIMLRLAVRREHPLHRDVRWLAEDVIFHFPFLGSFTSRVGAVRACQENGERLLRHDALVAVFPEGMKGIGKLFKDRYRLQRFGRGGFVKLCLRTRTPIVPVAIVGGEETNPMLARVEYLTRALGVPYLPVTPTFPALGPLGLLPAPTKWKIMFGEPIDLEGYGAESAEDEVLVGRLTERVRGAIQATLDRAVSERRSVWFG
ncbi:MAG: lysophospholipid acyltransferase family protein [Polyangiaceae bacterium]